MQNNIFTPYFCMCMCNCWCEKFEHSWVCMCNGACSITHRKLHTVSWKGLSNTNTLPSDFVNFKAMLCPNFVDTESDGRVDKLNAFDKHNYELEKVIQEVLMTGFMNVRSCSRPERQSKTYCCPKLIYNDNFSTKI